VRKHAVRLTLFFLAWAVLLVVLWRVPAVRGGFAGFLRPVVNLFSGRSGPAPGQMAPGDQLELYRLQAAERRVTELESMLDLPHSTAWDTVACTVTGRDPAAWDLSFRIGKGSDAGVREGAAVFARGYVVGKVISVSPQSAVVRTVLAPDCQIGARLGTTGGVGVLRGRKGGRTICLVDYLDRDLNYRVGEEVLTSGLSDVVPGGLPLGRVVPWDSEHTAHIVGSSYAQLRSRAATAREDFRYVWVVALKREVGSEDVQ